MRILIVGAVFPPEPIVSSQTNAQIANELVKRGHNVTVITAFPNRPGGQLYPGYARKLFQRQRITDELDLVRCFSTLSSESSTISRFLENVSFGLTGGWAALTTPHPDVIYANTWPIFATGILFAVSKLRCVPMVISIQDVYPESLVAQGRVWADDFIVRGMQRLDAAIARGSRAVITISEHFAVIYRSNRRVAPERVHVIPNWAERNAITFDDQPQQFRQERNILPDTFAVGYGGNIGVAAGVETVIRSFRHLQDGRNFALIVAGEGSRLAACQELAAGISDGQVFFHTPWPVEETSLVLRAADVLVLPTLGRQSLVSVPSKLISYMLAARPVIALALPQSDIAMIVRQSGCGWVIQPDQPEVLAAQIREVAAMDAAELSRRGHAGREFALENYTREVCLPRIVDILEQAGAD